MGVGEGVDEGEWVEDFWFVGWDYFIISVDVDFPEHLQLSFIIM